MSPIRPGSLVVVNNRSNFLQPEPVVDGMTELLLTAKVAFGRLHGDVAQKKLNLLQLTSGEMAQTRASSPQVMGSEVLDKIALPGADGCCIM